MNHADMVSIIKEQKRTIRELRKQLDREDLGRCPEYGNARSDEELVGLFDHMGYADGDCGYYRRYFSYAEGRRIQDLMRLALGK